MKASAVHVPQSPVLYYANNQMLRVMSCKLSKMTARGLLPLKISLSANPEPITFTLTEDAGSDTAIKYDAAVYTVSIKVTQTDNALAASVSYLKDGEAYTGTPAFANTTIPVAPDNPDKPDSSENEDSSIPADGKDNPTDSNKPIYTGVPKTGDTSNFGLIAAFMALSLFGMGVAGLMLRKSRRHKTEDR